MKKTRKTRLTSALLSAAVVLHSESSIANSAVADMKNEMSAPVYGPPSVLYRYSRGDLNDDEKIDIVDYILMKAKHENPDQDINIGWADDVFKSDLDEDSRLTEKDLKIFERYLFGKIPSVRGTVYDDDYDDNPESVVTDPYTREPVVTDISAAETTPVMTPVTQPAYGTYPTSSTETTESAMPDYETSSAGTSPVTTTITLPVTTAVYGPYPAVTSETTESAMPDYESYYNVTTTVATPVTQPVYGTYPTKTTVTSQSEVPDYETYPEVTTANVSE